MPTLSVIIPVYNEAATIALVLDKVIEAPINSLINKEIIVVNDGSKDATKEAIDNYVAKSKQQTIRVLHKDINEGKGAAIHSGIKLATGDYIIIQDGDLELDPAEFSLLLEPILKGFADVVYGSRFKGSKPHRVMNFFHSGGNKALTFISNVFTNLNLSDMETCYKLFKADILKNIDLKEKRFGFEPEVTAKIARIKGIRIYEVGISYYGRTRSDGKKIGWKDLFRAIWCIVKYNVPKKVLPVAVFIFIALACIFSVANFRLQNNDWKDCIRGDGYGYYGYLPAIFIVHHFDYNKVIDYEKSIDPNKPIPDIPGPFGINNQVQFDKCYAGVALMLTPFFLIAWFLSFLFQQNMYGGYSIIFQESVALASVFYLFIGLVFIRKLLQEYKVPDLAILVSVLLVFFGTNLFYYTVEQPSMSHQYSFCAAAMFLYYVRRSVSNSNFKNLAGVAATIALLALIRPTNAICVAAIPFLAGNFNSFKTFCNAVFRLKTFLPLLLITGGIYSIQLILWFFETGHFYIWSYVGEHFDFAHPHFLDILFSYRKGLFVYTPLIMLSLICGSIYLAKKNLFAFGGFILFFLVVTYILSSWECWYYGGSYGLRAYIDFYPVFITGFALILASAIKNWIKTSIVIVGIICTFLNLFQTWQFNHFLLPFDGTTKNLYWNIFLKTNIDDIQGLIPFPDSTKIRLYPALQFSCDFEGKEPSWKLPGVATRKSTGYISPDSNYCSKFNLPVNQLPKDSNLGVLVTTWAKTSDKNNRANIIVSLETKDGHPYFWERRPIMNYIEKTDTWQEAGFMPEFPAFKNDDDRVVIYLTCTKGLFYVDGFNIRFGQFGQH